MSAGRGDGRRGGRGGGRSTKGVRITGGELRGRWVAVPATARPTEGRVREALFSIWSQEVPGSRFLDLFAGSGVVAVEAASRGALTVVAVESDPRAFRRLEANLRRLDLTGLVEAHRGVLPGWLERWSEEGGEEGRLPFHLVFADPPYVWEGYRELLTAIAPLLAEDGWIAIEHSARVELPVELPVEVAIESAEETAPLVRADVRRYGESVLSLYRQLVTG